MRSRRLDSLPPSMTRIAQAGSVALQFTALLAIGLMVQNNLSQWGKEEFAGSSSSHAPSGADASAAHDLLSHHAAAGDDDLGDGHHHVDGGAATVMTKARLQSWLKGARRLRADVAAANEERDRLADEVSALRQMLRGRTAAGGGYGDGALAGDDGINRMEIDTIDDTEADAGTLEDKRLRRLGVDVGPPDNHDGLAGGTHPTIVENSLLEAAVHDAARRAKSTAQP